MMCKKENPGAGTAAGAGVVVIKKAGRQPDYTRAVLMLSRLAAWLGVLV